MKADWLPLSEAAAATRPYTSARSLLKGEGWVFLDANECPFTCPLDDLAIAGLNRYPDPTADHLRRNLAGHYLVSSDSVLVTNGSDELIDLCVRTFVRRGRSVLAPAPTYGMYAVAASSNGLAYRSVPLESTTEPEYGRSGSRVRGSGPALPVYSEQSYRHDLELRRCGRDHASIPGSRSRGRGLR